MDPSQKALAPRADAEKASSVSALPVPGVPGMPGSTSSSSGVTDMPPLAVEDTARGDAAESLPEESVPLSNTLLMNRGNTIDLLDEGSLAV